MLSHGRLEPCRQIAVLCTFYKVLSLAPYKVFASLQDNRYFDQVMSDK